MKNTKAMTAERGKELRGRHPLYSKLSGEVVWGLYEELGYSAEDCGKAMDAFLEQMRGILLLIDAMETDPEGLFVLEFNNPACLCCKFNAKSVVAVISAARADWRKFLPPFAVGCTAEARLLTDVERKSTGGKAALDEKLFPPSRQLMCPLLETLE